MTVYEQVGGEPAFRKLVSGFYARVREDPLLRPLYPDDELDDAEWRLGSFLMQPLRPSSWNRAPPTPTRRWPDR
jgi:hemoglobin